MARKVTPLTDTQIKQAKPNDREITLSDGKGLQLRITISGTKSWIFKYHTPITKKRTNLTLGKYPAISLAKARTLANEVRELLAQDIDPKEHRENKVKERLKRDKNTFLNVTTQWFEIKQIQITPAYAEDIWRSLENHVFPTLGNTTIDTINAPLAIEILKPLEASNKLETVKRLSQLQGAFFYAHVSS